MANNAITETHYCGSCGRRIQSHQAMLEINLFNSAGRPKGKEHYHETWEGCYESTRESGKWRRTLSQTLLNRYESGSLDKQEG